jgi:glutamate--cysteine ligase
VTDARLDRRYDRQLSALVNAREPGVLIGGLKGVEKESLRVSVDDGRIARTRHPRALGSSLTHEHVTTDYSEALIELVTPTFTESWELLQYLTDLHQFVYGHLSDEVLWSTSMPCRLQGDASIPIAEFGRSNVAQMKHVYRRGLGLRYGRIMQAISGVHFNYSFPTTFWDVWADIAAHAGGADQAFISESYFDVLRNYRRHGWIVPYLFGASPAVCRSFVAGRDDHGLTEFGPGTLYSPYATSLRMSDLGYRNKNQAGVSISVNSIDEYIRDMSRAISTPNAAYQAMGVEVEGEWRQLNANNLQIENEYYAFIRPKRVARSGERPTKALRRAGVQYVEMRSLDVSVLDPVGVNQNKLRFLEAFAAFCVIAPSPTLTSSELAALDGNHATVARRGREPGLTLLLDGRPRPLSVWGSEILDAMEGVCELLDGADPARPYTAALRTARGKIHDVDSTPSARILREMHERDESFYDFAYRTSVGYRDYFRDLAPLAAGRHAEFTGEVEASWAAHEHLEATDRGTFQEYLAAYFAE